LCFDIDHKWHTVGVPDNFVSAHRDTRPDAHAHDSTSYFDTHPVSNQQPNPRTHPISDHDARPDAHTHDRTSYFGTHPVSDQQPDVRPYLV
jgi:hypothetical protein